MKLNKQEAFQIYNTITKNGVLVKPYAHMNQKERHVVDLLDNGGWFELYNELPSSPLSQKTQDDIATFDYSTSEYTYSVDGIMSEEEFNKRFNR